MKMWSWDSESAKWEVTPDDWWFDKLDNYALHPEREVRIRGDFTTPGNGTQVERTFVMNPVEWKAFLHCARIGVAAMKIMGYPSHQIAGWFASGQVTSDAISYAPPESLPSSDPPTP